MDKKKILQELQKTFPNGHEKYIPILLDLMELHSIKNHDYAAGGNPLGNFDRVAHFFESYPNLKLSDSFVVALCYMMKQLDAALWLKNNGHAAKVQGIGERMDDIIVYATIAKIIEENDK
jgi:hypothetical protein